MLVRLLGAEGASGSPIVDDRGSVVGVLQLGLGGKDILGQRTSGVVAGIDLPSWWGSGRKVERALCQAYSAGAILDCESSTPTPLPTPPPPPQPAIAACWLQQTDNSWANVNQAAAIATISDAGILAAPQNFWTIVKLTSTPTSDVPVSVDLISPNGVHWGGAEEAVPSGRDSNAWTLDWRESTGSPVFGDPTLTGGQGTWIVRFQLVLGQTCDVTFTVTP